MEIRLYMLGRNSMPFLEHGMKEFTQRIERYVRFSVHVINVPKSVSKLSPAEQKRKEGELVLRAMEGEGVTIILDEKGDSLDSRGFAAFLQKRMNHSTGTIAFCIGGALGFSGEVKSRADHVLSLSDMTFSHQMIRLIFLEQLYRAFTIIRNEPYHND